MCIICGGDLEHREHIIVVLAVVRAHVIRVDGEADGEEQDDDGDVACNDGLLQSRSSSCDSSSRGHLCHGFVHGRRQQGGLHRSRGLDLGAGLAGEGGERDLEDLDLVIEVVGHLDDSHRSARSGQLDVVLDSVSSSPLFALGVHVLLAAGNAVDLETALAKLGAPFDGEDLLLPFAPLGGVAVVVALAATVFAHGVGELEFPVGRRGAGRAVVRPAGVDLSRWADARAVARAAAASAMLFAAVVWIGGVDGPNHTLLGGPGRVLVVPILDHAMAEAVKDGLGDSRRVEQILRVGHVDVVRVGAALTDGLNHSLQNLSWVRARSRNLKRPPLDVQVESEVEDLLPERWEVRASHERHSTKISP